jgi:hypothetical protein
VEQTDPRHRDARQKARVKLTLRLREYDEYTGTWNRLGHVRWRKVFNIVP